MLLLQRFVLFVLLKSGIESLFLNKFNKSLPLQKSFMLSLVSGVISIVGTLATLWTLTQATPTFNFNHLTPDKTVHFFIHTVTPLVFIFINNVIFFRLITHKLLKITKVCHVPFIIGIGLLSGTLLFGALYHTGSPLLCFLHLQ